jgi:hypothetical protein
VIECGSQRGYPTAIPAQVDAPPDATAREQFVMSSGRRKAPDAALVKSALLVQGGSAKWFGDCSMRRFAMSYKAIAGVGLVLISAVLAQAGTDAEPVGHTTWGKSGDWEILIDSNVGNGCYMEKTFENGTLVQVGIVPDRDGGFFAAYNADWREIEDGDAGTVRFDFGDALFGGDVVGVVKGDLRGGYAFFNNPAFIKEFAKRNTVEITAKWGSAIEIGLKGTSNAIKAVLKCDSEQPKSE